MQPNIPPHPQPSATPNPVTKFFTDNRTLPTWGLIIAILVACGFGFLVHSGGSVSTVTTTTSANTSATHVPTHPAGTAIPKATATPKPTAGPLESYSGDSDQTTANFTITSDQWTIAWTCTGNQYAVFTINVYNSDGSASDLEAANPPCTSDQSGSTIEHGAGKFYLMIGANATTWTVKITQ